MFELAIALAIVTSLILAAVVPAGPLLWVGVTLGSVGAVLGVPAGIVYHLELWRALQRGGQPTDGFWLRPHLLHRHLADDERGPIEAWFAAGVVGFVSTVLGGVAVAVAFVRLLTG